MTDQPVVVEGPAEDLYQPFPTFNEFLHNRVDMRTVDQFVGVLEGAKADAGGDRLRSAVDTATRWAAVDTGAIEGLYDVDRGFTFSVAAGAAAWDNMHLSVGDEAARAIEDALKGYDYVLDAVTQARPITESWIRELHSIICASQGVYSVLTAAGPQQHELPKGKYKVHQNNPFNINAQRVHAYAPVADTPAEMNRLVDQLRSDEFSSAHPVVQAAYAHYAFVCIHPFADGNGRVSRALASVYLYRSPGVPLVIFADQKPQYLDALEAADAGSHTPFVQFVADRAIDVVRMVAAEMRRPPKVDTAERMKELQRALVGRGGLAHEEIDALAWLFFDQWVAAVQRAIDNNPVQTPLSLKLEVVSGGLVPTAPDGYRSPPNGRYVRVTASSGGYASATVVSSFGPLVARGQSDLVDFVMVRGRNAAPVEEALLRDLHPTVSPSLTFRLDIAAEDAILRLIERVAKAAEEKLRESGYKD